MNNMLIQDELVLLSIHPESGKIRRRSMIGNLLTAAALFDLVLMKKLKIVTGNIHAFAGETGDPVLNLLISRLCHHEGKKLSWFLTRNSITAGREYRLRMQHLTERHLVSSVPLVWMGIIWGRRYRVTRYDRLKPLITKIDRVLIYGRKPDLKTRIIIELLGLLQLQGSLYQSKEQIRRARARVKVIAASAFEEEDPSYGEIMKQTRKISQQKQQT